MTTGLPVGKLSLHVPSLEEVAKVLQDGLSHNFADVCVSVVECPDLTQPPFYLADKGLNGSPRLADIGGVPNLVPCVRKEKKYDFDNIAKLSEIGEDAFIVGAGAGPAHLLGTNSELIPNVKLGTQGNIQTHCCLIDPKENSYVLKKLDNKEFCLLMNLFLSEGKPGKVLEVKARQRTGEDNYMSCIRKTLANHYGNKPVGLGGVFLLKDGKAKLHVMPNFSDKPLETESDMNNWLKFFEMSGPLICLGHLISHDLADMDLRMEHFHCFSEHGDGGHYHYDTTPNTVSYTGYFNLGEYMYRIDQNEEKTTFGKD